MCCIFIHVFIRHILFDFEGQIRCNKSPGLSGFSYKMVHADFFIEITTFCDF